MEQPKEEPREPKEQPKAPAKAQKTVVFDVDNIEKVEDVEARPARVTAKEVPAHSPTRRRRGGGIWGGLTRQLSTRAVGKKRAWYARGIAIVLFLLLLASIAFLVWTLLVQTLIHYLTPALPRNGVTTIVSSWKEPTSNADTQTSWLPNFSSGITPKPIHSHNDYSRDIPLFRALSVGCTGVEADIHIVNNDLLVGHRDNNLRPARTLSSLYLGPLLNILDSQNKQVIRTNATAPPIGVFSDKPQETLYLLLDFKTDPTITLPLVVSQLQPFRDAHYLTHWDGEKVVPGPIAVVASGLASRRLDLLPSAAGGIFLDAPLDELAKSGSAYNTSNSIWASVPLSPALGGWVPLSGMNKGQLSKVEALVKDAQARGLKARFWGTPTWPIGLRDQVWKQLVGNGVGMLNVDDVKRAALWNWDWCKVAGLRLC